MGTMRKDIHNPFDDRIPNDLFKKINFERVFKVIKKRTTFARYYQLISNYEESNLNNSSIKRNKSLFKSIITNESELREFIHILLHTGQDDIAKEIDPNVIDLCELKRCDPKSGHKFQFSFGDTNPKEILENHREASSSSMYRIYPMYQNPRGYCYLINNYFTIGTYKEMQRFRNIFYQLHFDVVMRKNLSVYEIEKLLTDLSKNKNLKQHEAFIFMILTTGDNKKIFDHENQAIDISKLTQLFDDENCPHMKGKPRLFFFNCCPNEISKGLAKQAELTEKYRLSPTFSDVDDLFLNISDVFICLSTFEDIVNWDKGSKFGRQLADCLIEKASYKDLKAIIIRTSHHLQFTLRNSSRLIVWSQLKKYLYFNYMIPKTRAYFSTLTISLINTEQTLENCMKKLEYSNYIDSIQLLRQLCKELKFLHHEGIVHNDINPKNIKIEILHNNRLIKAMLVKDFANTKIQFSDDPTVDSSSEGKLCWKSPQVIEALKKDENFEASKENDIFSLGCLFYYVMTSGQHPFGYNAENIIKENLNTACLSGDDNQIYIDLIERMLNYNETDRPSIDSVLNHPMFWKSDKILQFYNDIDDLLQPEDDKVMKTIHFKRMQEKVRNNLQTISKDVYGDDWLSKLSNVIQNYERKKKTNSTSYIELINFISKKDQNLKEWSENMETKLFSTEGLYIEHFTKQIPLLLINTYNVMKVFKDERKLYHYYI